MSIDFDALMDDVKKPSYGSDNTESQSHGKKDDSKKDTVNMYDVEFIEPKDIDTDTFEKKGRSFMVETHNAPEDVVEKIIKVSAKLIREGFKFRHDGNAEDEVQNKILTMCEAKDVESFLPFKKYNENIEKPITPNTFELPYKYAAKIYGPAYNEKLSKGAKAVYASKVHAILGKESDNPIDFLICYNVNGDEVYPPYKKNGPKIDYSKLGNLGFYLKVTDKTNINVYNFKNMDSIKNLLELISA